MAARKPAANKKPSRAQRSDSLYRADFCARVQKLVNDAIAADEAPPSRTQLAVALGVSRACFYNWIDRHPEFSEAVERAGNACQVYFEKKAWEIATGRTDAKPAMMIFLLKCRFAPKEGDRGEHYTDRHEVTGAGGAPFVLKLSADDAAL